MSDFVPMSERKSFLRDLADGLPDELEARIHEDLETGPYLICKRGERRWLYVSVSPFGIVTVQESASETGSMTGGIHWHGEGLAETIQAINNLKWNGS